MEEEPPLTTLLSWAWIAFAIEADNAVEATDARHLRPRFLISCAMWANALRLIDDEGVTLDAVRTRAHAGANIPGLERWGWISVGQVSGGRRDGYGTSRGLRHDSVLRPTRAGAFARELWPRMIAGVEGRWEERFGAEVIDSLRRSLQPRGRGMPAAPPEVAPGDGFRTHVITVPLAAEHERPLATLLAQALTELTLEHERGSAVSLPLAANFLRVIDERTVRVRDLPALTGVSKEATAMAMSFLKRRGLAEVGPGPTVELTASGSAARDDYTRRARRTTDDGLGSVISAILSRREPLRRGLVPPETSWRWRSGYAAQTRRLVDDPLVRCRGTPWCCTAEAGPTDRDRRGIAASTSA